MQPENALFPDSPRPQATTDGCDMAILKGKISASQRRRNLTRVGITSIYCAGILLIGRVDPDFFQLDGIAISIAFIWGVTAICEIHTSRILFRLAIARIGERNARRAGQA